MVKEYIINSKKYDKTIDNFYVQFHYSDKTKKEGRGTIGLYRFVMNPLPGFQVDHINRNPLDNRKCNLRLCTQQDNAKNKSRYKNKKYRKQCSSFEEAIKKREELYNSLVAKGVINNVIYR